MTVLKAPFPYFGGKSSIAHEVWAALGQPKHYIEPCFGSGAVLLARPNPLPGTHMETVNDADGYISNAWRALQADPDAVAKVCDYPVSHVDLSARKAVLIRNGETLLARLIADDKYFDVEMAGYWIWAASCWIGSGLTSLGKIPHISDGGRGVHALGQIPHIIHGMGVHALGQIPHIIHGGKGVHALGKRPHIIHGGKGVHALGKRPHIANGGEVVDVREPYNTNLYVWFRQLSERLRYVRVVCGDWTRVCGGDWQDKIGTVGIYFDPPYAHDVGRDKDIYHVESADVSRDIVKWAAERGDRPTYRIVISGYAGEHDWLAKRGWRCHQWKAQGGYANLGDGAGMENRHREVLWMSPHCLRGQERMDF